MISPLKQMKNQATLSANICRPPISIFMTMQTALLKKQPLAMWIIYEPQTILTEFTTFIVMSHPVVTYKVIISGEENDSVRNVFNNLELKLEDTGNVEAPLPMGWNSIHTGSAEYSCWRLYRHSGVYSI